MFTLLGQKQADLGEPRPRDGYKCKGICSQVICNLRWERLFLIPGYCVASSGWRWRRTSGGRSQGYAHRLGCQWCLEKNRWGLQERNGHETHHLRTGKVGHYPLNRPSAWKVEEAASPVQCDENPQWTEWGSLQKIYYDLMDSVLSHCPCMSGSMVHDIMPLDRSFLMYEIVLKYAIKTKTHEWIKLLSN